ncbi:MAG: ankyrin repeat domain-containing protein [Leptospiraceae bacterium]|nr:ankyrin repeat domain-containing protein [Leptospiraceae bacterium]
MENSEPAMSQEEIDRRLAELDDANPEESKQLVHRRSKYEYPYSPSQSRALEFLSGLRTQSEDYATDLELISASLSSGNEFNIEEADLEPLLARYCHLSILEVLLADGLNINAADSRGYTALFFAVDANDLPRIELLISHGANLDVRCGKTQSTPLNIACDHEKPDALQILLGAGADINYKDGSGSAALHMAVFNQNARFVRLLAEAGADINIAENSGRTALHMACSLGSPEMVQLLLDLGADMELRTQEGVTCFLIAMSSGITMKNGKAVIKLLIENGADINAVDNSGCNAIFWAVCHDALDIARLLMAGGADPHQRVTETGKNAIDRARDEGNEAFLKLFDA